MSFEKLFFLALFLRHIVNRRGGKGRIAGPGEDNGRDERLFLFDAEVDFSFLTFFLSCSTVWDSCISFALSRTWRC